MKVSILYSHLKERGGAENVILKQAELLGRRHDVKCYFAYVEKGLQELLNNPISSYYKFPIPNNETARIILSIPLAPLTLPLLSDSDLLLCHGYGSASWIGYTLKRIKGLRYVSYIHFPPRFLYLNSDIRRIWRYNTTRTLIYNLSKVTEPLLKRLDLISVSASDRVLVNSQYTARRVRTIYGVQPIVCYPPVDTNIFRPLEDGIIQKIRSKLGSPMILSTGRIAPIKRLEWLISIMPRIVEVYPSATLAITGEISEENSLYFQKLKKLAESLQVARNVKFLGFKPVGELVKIYNAADVYAYQTPKEDFGLGPAESLACGTPAVVWDDGAGPCEIVDHGRTGFRAKPYDLEDFAEKILRAIDMPKDIIREKAHKFIKENFSSEKHLNILENVLNEF